MEQNPRPEMGNLSASSILRLEAKHAELASKLIHADPTERQMRSGCGFGSLPLLHTWDVGE